MKISHEMSLDDRLTVLDVLGLIGPEYPKTLEEAAQYLGWSLREVNLALAAVGRYY